MHALVALFWIKVVSLSLFFAVALVALTILERLFPRASDYQSPRGQAVLFWLLWIPCTAAMFAAFTMIWLRVGWRPRFAWRIGDLLAHLGPARLILAPVAGALIGDFFFYWFHRGQHAFLWPLHAVHHSIEDLNAANSYHHVTEELMRSVLLTLPMSWFTIDLGESLPIVATLLALQPVYLHSPTRLHLGRGRAIFADNRFHRIHHSVEPRHFDKNFGACTTLWDRIFGTAYFPQPDEWPRTGIQGVPAPRSVRAWLTLPLRVVWRLPAAKSASGAPPPSRLTVGADRP